jgi:hypothetical protein
LALAKAVRSVTTAILTQIEKRIIGSLTYRAVEAGSALSNPVAIEPFTNESKHTTICLTQVVEQSDWPSVSFHRS